MTKITRRGMLSNALAGATVLAGGGLPFAGRARPGGRQQLVISGWGGATQQAMRQAYFKPFTRETGIEIVEQTYGSLGLARIKAQLREGASRVDLLDGAPFWPVIGRKQGLLDKITLPGVDKSRFIAGAIDDYGFGYATVSWGITCLKQGRPAPTCWQDFWNTSGFPGRRAFFGPFVARHPEYALMADGVPAKDIYPLNDAKVKRAFAKLARIVPSIDVWYQTAAQCEQLLLGRQIDMVEFFNGRAFYLQDQGVPLEFVWNEAIMNIPMFVLARNAPNHDNALKFLSYLAQPEPQAAFARLIHYGPTNTQALQLIGEHKVLERLPTFAPNIAKQIALDANWWSANHDRLSPRWNQLMSA